MITISTVLCRSGGGGEGRSTDYFLHPNLAAKINSTEVTIVEIQIRSDHCTNNISRRTSRVRQTKGSLLEQRNDRRENYDRLETISLKKKLSSARKGEAWGKPRFIQVRAPIAKWWKREESVERGESP